MLEQIESALYAEDPKFASSVRGGRLRTTTSRRRLQAAALFALGLLLLIVGIAGPKPGGFPIISLIGFVIMFGAGVLLLVGSSKGSRTGGDVPTGRAGSGGASGRSSGGGRGPGGRQRKSGGFSERMEDRFRRRFEQD